MESLHPSQPQRKRSQGHEEAHWMGARVSCCRSSQRFPHNPAQHTTTNVIRPFDHASFNRMDGSRVYSTISRLQVVKLLICNVEDFTHCVKVFVRNKHHSLWLWLSSSGHIWVPWHTKLVIITVIIITANMSVHFDSTWALEKWVTSSSDTNVFLGQWHFEMQSSCH